MCVSTAWGLSSALRTLFWLRIHIPIPIPILIPIPIRIPIPMPWSTMRTDVQASEFCRWPTSDIVCVLLQQMNMQSFEKEIKQRKLPGIFNRICGPAAAGHELQIQSEIMIFQDLFSKHKESKIEKKKN